MRMERTWNRKCGQYDSCVHKPLFWLLLLTVLLVHGADCLMCYQCATSSSSSPTADCIYNIEGMVNTSLGINDYYAANCTDTNPDWNRCVIMTAESGGLWTVYLRGCHDGIDFSREYDHDDFHNLPAFNQTTCRAVSLTKKIVCYTFCRSDYCNGPEKPSMEPSICEEYQANPYEVTLPPGVNCTAVGIHPSNGPIGLQLLVVALTSLLAMAYLGAA